MLVAGLLVVAVLKSWLVCFLFFYVFLDVVLEGGVKKQRGCRFCFYGVVKTTTSSEGGVQKNNNAAAVLVSRMW